MTILRTLDDAPADWVSKSQLKDTCGLAPNTFYTNVNKLIKKGCIDQVKKGNSEMLRFIPEEERPK
jgi:predicted transcriptional regulator